MHLHQSAHSLKALLHSDCSDIPRAPPRRAEYMCTHVHCGAARHKRMMTIDSALSSQVCACIASADERLEYLDTCAALVYYLSMASIRVACLT